MKRGVLEQNQLDLRMSFEKVIPNNVRSIIKNGLYYDLLKKEKTKSGRQRLELYRSPD